MTGCVMQCDTYGYKQQANVAHHNIKLVSCSTGHHSDLSYMACSVYLSKPLQHTSKPGADIQHLTRQYRSGISAPAPLSPLTPVAR
jgi:hypothetical protein